MKKYLLLLTFFFFVFSCINAQKNEIPSDSIDSAFWTIRKNNFRVLIDFPIVQIGTVPEGTGIIYGMYEYSQWRKFSLVSKIGINSYDKKYGNLSGFSYQFTASLEQRYYFNFKRRINLKKPIINNSGTYFGLEGRIVGAPFHQMDLSDYRTPESGFMLYYKIGHQVQISNFFLNYHFGLDLSLNRVTTGIGIGRVF